MREFYPDESMRCDVLAGGFPCTDISLAGRRAGIDGEHSGLWSEYARIIRVLRPRFAIVENVAAMLSFGLGRVLGDMAAVGFDAEWHVIPASAFGMPHIRRRLFVVAYPAADGRQGPVCRNLENIAQESSTTECGAGLQGALDSRRLAVERIEQRMGEPAVFRSNHGIPARLVKARLGGIGDAVVPAIAEWIGRRIMEAAQ